MKIFSLAAPIVLFVSAVRAESCAGNGTPPCQNKSICKLNDKKLIYCQGCDRTKWTGNRCEIPLKGQSCVYNGTNNGKLDPCQHGSKCNLNSQGLIYCTGCDKTKYTGYRCETPVTKPPPAGKESCEYNGTDADGTPNPCQHGTKCQLNGQSQIYCTGCNAKYYTGYRCETPAANCPIPCGRTAGSPLGEAVDYGFPDGKNMDTSCCTGGAKCFTKDRTSGTLGTSCQVPKTCPTGQTACGGGGDLGPRLYPNNTCCDDATQECKYSGGQGGGGTSCVAK